MKTKKKWTRAAAEKYVSQATEKDAVITDFLKRNDKGEYFVNRHVAHKARMKFDHGEYVKDLWAAAKTTGKTFLDAYDKKSKLMVKLAEHPDRDEVQRQFSEVDEEIRAGQDSFRRAMLKAVGVEQRSMRTVREMENAHTTETLLKMAGTLNMGDGA